jgi:Mor family transcriptional regulator
VPQVDETSRYFVEKIGFETYCQILDDLGGAAIYFPKSESFRREERNKKIFKAFDGANYRALAMQYNLSESYVRSIVNKKRRPE